jgi:hypothetical protein
MEAEWRRKRSVAVNDSPAPKADATPFQTQRPEW